MLQVATRDDQEASGTKKMLLAKRKPICGTCMVVLLVDLVRRGPHSHFEIREGVELTCTFVLVADVSSLGCAD